MKTVIKTTIKGSEAITIKESVSDVFDLLIDKGNFLMCNRINGEGQSLMIIKKSVIKIVVSRS